MDLQINLVSNDRTLMKSVKCSFTQEEWGIIEQFHVEVERLRATKFVQEGMGGQISVTIEPGSPITSNATAVDEEAVGYMLHRLRPFILQERNYNFYKVKKLLDKQLRCYPAFLQHLNNIKDHFDLKRMKPILRLPDAERPTLSQEVVMDWLNGIEYHRDADKLSSALRDLGLFGEDQGGRPVILFALVDMVQAVLGMGDLAETLMLAAAGQNEIGCPAEWLQET